MPESMIQELYQIQHQFRINGELVLTDAQRMQVLLAYVRVMSLAVAVLTPLALATLWALTKYTDQFRHRCPERLEHWATFGLSVLFVVPAAVAASFAVHGGLALAHLAWLAVPGPLWGLLGLLGGLWGLDELLGRPGR